MGLPFGQKYYWIAATVNGQHILLYPPYESENEARTKGFEKLRGVIFDIFKTDTKDQTKATQQYRMNIVDNSPEKAQAIEESLKRMKHQV